MLTIEAKKKIVQEKSTPYRGQPGHRVGLRSGQLHGDLCFVIAGISPR
jgi:hypothetical protein